MKTKAKPHENSHDRRTLLRCFVFASSSAIFLTACAHYYAPVNRLESPEASGTGKVGKLELLGFQAGTDLVAKTTLYYPEPQPSEPPPSPYPVMGQSWVNPFVGFTRALDDSIDITVRVQPAAPLLLRGKYQISGEPESRADAGNLSTAISASGGFLKGRGITSYQFDGALLAGYRLWRRHLFSASPFATYTKIDGLGADTGGASGSLLQYGGGLGYQYSYETLFFRFEAAYSLGASADNEVKGLFGGASMGFTL